MLLLFIVTRAGEPVAVFDTEAAANQFVDAVGGEIVSLPLHEARHLGH